MHHNTGQEIRLMKSNSRKNQFCEIILAFLGKTVKHACSNYSEEVNQTKEKLCFEEEEKS